MTNNTTHNLFPEILINLLNSISSPLCILDENRIILYSNSGFTELFKLEGDDQTGKRFGQTISCRAAHHQTNVSCTSCRFLQTVREAFVSKRTQEKKTMVMQLTPEHEQSLKLLQFEVCYFESGKNAFALAIFEDMTHVGDAAASIPYDWVKP